MQFQLRFPYGSHWKETGRGNITATINTRATTQPDVGMPWNQTVGPSPLCIAQRGIETCMNSSQVFTSVNRTL